MRAKYSKSRQSRKLCSYQDSVAISGMIKKYMEEKKRESDIDLERSLKHE